MSNTKGKSNNTAMLGLFCAIIIALQTISYFVKIGAFNLSLVLIPIVIGAYLFGTRFSTILGTVFGFIVALCSVLGLDGGGLILFQTSPILTVLVCILKGTLAGLAAGAVIKLLKNKNEYLAVICAAIVTPVVNTGVFIAVTTLFIKDGLAKLSGGTEYIYILITSVILVNFLFELALNVVIAPSLLRISKALKK